MQQEMSQTGDDLIFAAHAEQSYEWGNCAPLLLGVRMKRATLPDGE